MRKLLTSGICAGVAAVAAISLSAPPASAATWAVTNGGDIFAEDPDGTTLTAGSQTLECDLSDADGNVPTANPANPTPIGTISRLDFDGCSLGIFDFEVDTDADQVGAPWALNALSFSGGVTTGQITGIKATLSGPLCSATVTGPNGTDGTVSATYNNATSTLSVTGAGNLVIGSVSGCGGLISNGQSAGFNGDFVVTTIGGTGGGPVITFTP